MLKKILVTVAAIVGAGFLTNLVVTRVRSEA